MKRTILTIAGTLTLLLAGCSDSGDDTANTSATAAEDTSSATESATTESTEPSSSEDAEPQPTLDSAAPAPAPTDGNGGAPGAGGGNTGGGSEGTGGGHPFGTPVESGPCSLDEILQPGVTAEGKHVVCIRDTVNDDRGVWVEGPAPTGQVVREGDPCDDGYPDNPQAGDKGAQDADGKIMLCAGDKWVYGP